MGRRAFKYKNLHFCTWDLLKKIKNGFGAEVIETYRTGFVPMLYAGDVINLNKRLGKTETFIRHGTIISVEPILYKNIPPAGKKEIELSSIRKFKDQQWFFEIKIVLKIVEGVYEEAPSHD